MEKNEYTTISVPKSLRDRLAAIAKANYRKLSHQLEYWIEQEAERNQPEQKPADKNHTPDCK